MWSISNRRNTKREKKKTRKKRNSERSKMEFRFFFSFCSVSFIRLLETSIWFLIQRIQRRIAKFFQVFFLVKRIAKKSFIEIELCESTKFLSMNILDLIKFDALYATNKSTNAAKCPEELFSECFFSRKINKTQSFLSCQNLHFFFWSRIEKNVFGAKILDPISNIIAAWQ